MNSMIKYNDLIMSYIEVAEEYSEQVARVKGTRITVGEIAYMHLYGNSSINWIIENFEALTHAKVYAALSYYFDHKEDIDNQMHQNEQLVAAYADITLSELIEKTRKQSGS